MEHPAHRGRTPIRRKVPPPSRPSPTRVLPFARKPLHRDLLAGKGRILVASNRLPVVAKRDGGSEWSVEPASGGLVTALDPVMRERAGVWLGWPGTSEMGQEEMERALSTLPREPAAELRVVEMEGELHRRFYEGFSNQLLWPVLHGLGFLSTSEPGDWESYREVNRRFARALADLAREGDLIWIQDYHLMLVAQELRELGVENDLAFFLHTPFPRLPEWKAVPQYRELIRSLLRYDVVGFQTLRDEANFMEVAVAMGLRIDEAESGNERPGGRGCRTGSFPVSIDFQEFDEKARSEEVRQRADHLRRELGERQLLLGVDRLDYTKGLPQKLVGFDRALHRFPELRGRVVLRQLVVPSRTGIPAYADTKAEIEELVRRINAEWGSEDWTPVEYRYGRWDRTELLAHYRIADVALVTPLTDGMNLVAKEYCVANQGSGVLILSAFAGAAGTLGHSALLVHPRSPEGVAHAIQQACAMPAAERSARMQTARQSIRKADIQGWAENFLSAGNGSAPRPLFPRHGAS